MKIQLWSDLHLELTKDWGGRFLDTHYPAAETLVLAGDITSAVYREPLDLVFASTSMRWKHVVYVPGNHEFYKTSLTDGWANIKAAAHSYPNLHVLDNEGVTLDGVRFFGGTGWYPEISQHPMAPYEVDYDALRRCMSDFRLIREFEPAVYMSRKRLADALYSADENPDVVITHHLPHEACVQPKYKGDPFNCFFVSDLDVETVAPKLWLHGHTHSSVDVTIGATRVLANPHGYRNESHSRPLEQRLRGGGEMKPCEFCVQRVLLREAIVRGSYSTCSTPAPDPRNPKWILTRIFVVGHGEKWDKTLFGPHYRITVTCPAPQKCVCDRPRPLGQQVWGNSSDESWPHKCPECGYHAAVVADDGVTVIKCRAHDCPYFCPPPFTTIEEYHAWRTEARKARC